ncbi:MAG: hypothetical protein ACYS8W_07850 [Planctomycetota bacterium]|jgi:hypothetical protein
MKKLAWTVLALVAITFGALFGVYKHNKEIGKITEDTGFFSFLFGGGRVTEVADRDKDAEDLDKPGDEKMRRKGAPAPRKGESGRYAGKSKDDEDETVPGVIRPQFDRAQYERIFNAGKDSYTTADFKTAEEKYAEAAEFADTYREKERALKAERMSKRAKVFAALVSKISVEPIADGKGVAEISLAFGGREPFIARIIEENNNHVKIEKESGISATFQRDDINEVKRLTPEEFRGRLLIKLNRQIQDAEKGGKPSYIDLYQCVYYAARFNLTSRVTDLLERTFALDMATDLIEIFCPEDPVGLKVALLESFGRDIEAQKVRDSAGPAIAMAEPYEEPAREPEREIADTPKRVEEPADEPEDDRDGELPDPWRPAPDDADDDGEPLRRPGDPAPNRPAPRGGGSSAFESEPDYQRAQEAYHEGLKFYRRSLPGMPNYVENLRKAEPFMRTAMDILSRYAEQHPDNTMLDEQLQQINTILYDIYKRSPLQPGGK